MSAKILDHCTACDLCVPVCPTGAILPGPRYSVDADLCENCGYCAPACPVEAVRLDQAEPAKP